VLAFDLDHFKAVNDTFGHQVGDQVLRDVTAAARHALRDGDVLVRTGGEEFLVLLPGAGVGDVEAIGERLRRCAASVAVRTADGTVTLTVSVGGASFPATEAAGPDDLLEQVDRAVYRSKELGRDRLTMCHTSAARPVHA
jgi:two-component system, cell cycle response regulator